MPLLLPVMRHVLPMSDGLGCFAGVRSSSSKVLRRELETGGRDMEDILWTRAGDVAVHGQLSVMHFIPYV